jgi:hypothetical protein
MSVHCPKCGSRSLRFSRTRSTAERLWKIVGVRPLRCRDCHTRFVEKTWSPTDLAYARCPKCWRMDLSRRSGEHLQAPAYMLLALKLGAKAYRCEYCRCNFVSLRPRKERFSFHPWKKAETARRAPAEHPPLPAEPAPPASPPESLSSKTAEAIAWRKAAEAKRRSTG